MGTSVGEMRVVSFTRRPDLSVAVSTRELAWAGGALSGSSRHGSGGIRDPYGTVGRDERPRTRRTDAAALPRCRAIGAGRHRCPLSLLLRDRDLPRTRAPTLR